MAPSAVGQTAAGLGLEILRPETLTDWSPLSAGREADVFVVVAYGKMLPAKLLELPTHGCLNVHFSLLPRLRGAAPVQWALIEGHTLTGVTLIRLDEGLDTGPILAQTEEVISPDDTAGELESRLAERGADLLIDVLRLVGDGRATTHSQVEGLATRASKLTKADAHIDWSKDASDIVNRVRAFNPRPGAWGMVRFRRVKIWRVRASSDPSTDLPGTIDLAMPAALFVSTGNYQISIEELQPEGASRMSAAQFVSGYRPASGDRIS